MVAARVFDGSHGSTRTLDMVISRVTLRVINLTMSMFCTAMTARATSVMMEKISLICHSCKCDLTRITIRSLKPEQKYFPHTHQLLRVGVEGGKLIVHVAILEAYDM